MHLGGQTDRWIDQQVTTSARFRGRLLGHDVVPGTARQSHWIVANDHMLSRAAARGMWRLDGRSTSLLARPFRANPPVAVHAHYGIIAASHRHVAHCLGRPLVASVYGLDVTSKAYVGSRKWLRRYRRMFEQAFAVLCEGPAMAKRVAALGCSEERLRVVRLPADAHGLAYVRRRADDDFLVVMAGRWAAKKGFDTGIRAFARAFKGLGEARLLMVGGGEEESRYRAIVAEERIGRQVEWAGRLPFERFMTEIGRARVALYPSRSAPDGDSEGGAPVTLIESQWLGVPSLVADHDDLAWVAAPQGAVILSSTDIDGWAEALRGLHDDPGRLERMGAASSTFVRAHHSPAANLAAREAIYLEASA